MELYYRTEQLRPKRGDKIRERLEVTFIVRFHQNFVPLAFKTEETDTVC